MAVQLPTFADVGFADPRAAEAMPAYPQEDPGAAAESTFGQGLAKAGHAAMTLDAYGKIAQNRMDRAMADANWFAGAAQIDAALKAETDPARITALGQQYQDALQTAGGAIGDPDARQMWLTENAKHAIAGQKGADLRNLSIYRDNYKAGIEAQGNAVVGTGAQSEDPRGFDYARSRIADLADAARTSGSMSAVEAEALQQHLNKQLIGGKAGWLANQGRADEVGKLLDANPSAVDPITEQSLRAHALQKGRKLNTDTAALEALGLPTTGMAIGSLPQDPSATGMAIGGAVPQRIAAEAQAQNVDPATALATAHIESRMGHNLGSRGNIFQLGKPEWAGVGGGNMTDTGTQIRNGIAFLSKTESDLADRLGRQPQPWEIYLAHQQGVAGATALMNHPDTPAGDLVGKAAISGNGGDPNAPASAFVAKWRGNFNHNLALYSGPNTPDTASGGNAPAAPEAGGGGFDLAAGDSIAVGSIRHGGIPGNAVTLVGNAGAEQADAAGGRNPQQGLEFIKAHPERFQGKTVLWSSGLMNADLKNYAPEAALQAVGQQLDALKAAGAKVVLAGVDTGKFGKYNSALAAIADDKGVPFAGPLPTSDVHPSRQGYKQYADAAVKLIPAGAQGAAPANAGVVNENTDPDLAAQINAAPAAGEPVPRDNQNQGGGQPDQLADQPGQSGAQPIGTGQPGPAAAGQPPSRTGLPSLTQTYLNILRNPRIKTDEDVRAAFATATAMHNAMEADAARAERITTQRQQQAMETRTNQIWADTYSGNPTITAQQLAVDPAFNGNNERRKAMIELVNNPPGSSVPAPQSYAAAQSMIERMRLPEGDPQKITTKDQIYDQMRSLNRADLEFALKKFDDLSSPGDQRFSQRLETFFKGVEPQIDKSGALPGLPSDMVGKAKGYEYRRMVEDQVAAYRKAGKNPDDLINPAKPDYLGKPESLRPFKRSLTEALADFSKENNGPLGVSGDAVNTPDKLKAALASGKLSREQAEAEALLRGWIRPAAPPRIDLTPLAR